MNIMHPIHAILEFYMQVSGCKFEIMRVKASLQNPRNLHVVCWCGVFEVSYYLL